MEQIIYGDVLFAVNFSMDFVCLCAAGKLCRTRLNPARIAAASAIGGVYGVASVFVRVPSPVSYAAASAAAAVICLAAFERSGAGALLRRTAVFFLVSSALGGAMTALYSAAGKRADGMPAVLNGSPVTLVRPPPFSAIALLFFAAALILFAGIRMIRRRAGVRRARLKLMVGRRTLELDALCDSGNLCTDPIGGLPVVFVTSNRLRELIPDSAVEAMSSGGAEGISALPRELARKTRAVPMKTVNGQGMGLALVADGASVDGQPRRCCIAAAPAAFGDEEAMIPESLCGK